MIPTIELSPQDMKTVRTLLSKWEVPLHKYIKPQDTLEWEICMIQCRLIDKK